MHLPLRISCCLWISVFVFAEYSQAQDIRDSGTEKIQLATPEMVTKAEFEEGVESEQSVNPGVNKGYKDPNLNVEKMVNRFELESREIYANRAEIVAACGIQLGDRVADVGAGTGLFSRLFSKSVGAEGWVYAVDIAAPMIGHIVKEAAAQKITNLSGVVCADDSIGLPENSVDLIFICDTYHHFEFPQTSLASFRRALRPGGRLVVIDFERVKGQSRDWVMGHVRAGKDVFRAEIQDAGFDFQEEKVIEGFQENYFLSFQSSRR